MHEARQGSRAVDRRRLIVLLGNLLQAGQKNDVAAIVALFEEVRAEYEKVISLLSRIDWVETAKQ